MEPLDIIPSEKVRNRILSMINILGRCPAISCAQRVVGQKETGGLTASDAEHLGGMNEDNFLQNYTNICKSYVRNVVTGTDEQKSEMIKQITV